MVENFPLLKQPSGSNDCLPTVVRAVLQWHSERITARQAAEWCRVTEDGCWIDAALEGLRFEGFDIEELSRDEERVIFAVTDADDPHPVIVTLQNSIASRTDHAVVLLGIETDAEGGETVFYFDPLTGAIEQDATGEFWINWQYAGERAFVLRP